MYERRIKTPVMELNDQPRPRDSSKRRRCRPALWIAFNYNLPRYARSRVRDRADRISPARKISVRRTRIGDRWFHCNLPGNGTSVDARRSDVARIEFSRDTNLRGLISIRANCSRAPAIRAAFRPVVFNRAPTFVLFGAFNCTGRNEQRG